MKSILWLLAVMLITPVLAQKAQKPKIVVGIVIDQMVYDYLYRFQSRFSDGGFALMMNKGLHVRNAQYNYVPTYTGPGHASIYTGATPNVHGIVANAWYDREGEEKVNCVTDSNYFTVGSESNYGIRSPKTLKCMTITDQLKLTYPKSKVISVSLKDRGAILPGGHLSDGSYWFDYVTGRLITSEFFKKELPQWVKDFNAKEYPTACLSETWSTLYPLETYVASGPDESPYEHPFAGKDQAVFPYDFSKVVAKKADYGLFATSPFANTYLTDFALQALKSEQLGKDGATDFLCISYSTPDIAGHAFGPYSVEIEDMYLRLDLELKRLIETLKKQVGEDVVIFLTADHAVVPVPQMLMDKNLPGGYLFINDLMKDLHETVKAQFGSDLISIECNNNIYFNMDLLELVEVDKDEVERFVANEILKWPGVKAAYTTQDLSSAQTGDHYLEKIKKGYDAKRSGNVLFCLEPGFLTKSKDSESARMGTSHGSGYAYDTHVPLLWYGKNIPTKEVFRTVEITDIVPTLTHILQLQNPNCAIGTPILELFQ